MRFLVYKLIRSDDKIYIGMTMDSRFNNRMREHKIHKRMRGYTFSVEILHSNLSFESASLLEEQEIKNYNSFYNGLNNSINGKGNHLSEKFTTYNYKFSEESRKKMSISQRKRKNRRRGFTIPNDVRKKISDKLKGRRLTTKLTEEKVREIRDFYNSKPIIENVGKIMKNGKIMSYEQAFSLTYHKTYGLSITGLRKIIKNEVWINV